jgi:hypothetical protein
MGFSYRFYIAPILFEFQNMPISWVISTGNGNMAKKRWWRTKRTNYCPAPQSEAKPNDRLSF